MNRFSTTILLLALLYPSSLAAAPFFMGLAPLPNGGSSPNARAVSYDGSVVVGSEGQFGSYGRAVRWVNGVPEDLGVSNSAQVATDVSHDGSVIVGEYSSTLPRHGFIWSAGAVNNVSRFSFQGLNAAGTVAVGHTAQNDLVRHAARWEAGQITLLEEPTGPMPRSAAEAVSADGNIVVGSAGASTTTNAMEPVVWTGGSMSVLSGAGGFGLATDITPDGSAIVGHVASGTTGAVWRNGAIEWLERGPAISGVIVPWSISDDGRTIVGEGFRIGSIAMIWDENGTGRALSEVLNSLGVATDGWQLEQAYAVSGDGRTVVGSGRNSQGVRHSWIAFLPEPSLAWMLASCGFAVAANGVRGQRT